MAMLNNQRVPILTGEETPFLVNYSSRWCFQPSCMNDMYSKKRQPMFLVVSCGFAQTNTYFWLLEPGHKIYSKSMHAYIASHPIRSNFMTSHYKAYANAYEKQYAIIDNNR